MSKIQVGRAGALSEATFSALSMGSALRVTGDLLQDGADLSYAAAQFVALTGNPDEPVVPVSFSEAPWLDGFYRVAQASVDSTHPSYWTLSLDLEPVRSFSSPLFESRLLGGKRTGVAAGVSPIAWHGLPNGVDGWQNHSLGANSPTSLIYNGETGYVFVVRDDANTQFNATVSYFLSPAEWYQAASVLTVAGHVAVGRECRNAPADWQVSNGLVRVKSRATASVDVERWDAGTGAWIALGTFTFGYQLSSVFTGFRAPHTLTVLRNAPSCVAIRLSCGVTTMPSAGMVRDLATVDLVLRRGSRAVEVTVSSQQAKMYAVAVPFDLDTAVAGTGGAAASASGAGVAYGSGVMSGAQDLVTLAATGKRLVMGMGYVGSTVTAPYVSDWVSLYAAAQVESVLAVAR